MRIKVTECQEIFTIGKTGENLVTEVEFPAYEGMRAALTYKRANDETPYPIALTEDEDGWVWTVTSTDLAQHGHGRCEVIYTEGEAVKLSRMWFVNVKESIEPAGEVPSGWESYYEDIIEAGNNAQEAATEAAGYAESAGASAQTASASEANALASERAASSSETNAAASELAAAGSETNAAASERNAAASETAAAESARLAGLSEDSAAGSARDAAADALDAKGYKEDAEAAAIRSEAAAVREMSIYLGTDDNNKFCILTRED